MPIAPPTHRPPGVLASEQRRARFDRERPPSSQRGYDTAWKKCRALFLAKFPWCSFLLPDGTKCRERATDVDHKISPRVRPDLRLNWSNLRGGCHSCHSRRTAKDQGFANPELRRY